jgi:PAS domain S-box-containing protein
MMPLDVELTRKVLEAAPSILYVYDVQNGRSVFQNRAIGELLGHSAGDAPGQANGLDEWTNFIHPEDAEQFPKHRKRLEAIRSGEVLSWEFRLRGVDGQWRWFLSRNSLLSADAQSRPLLVVGSAADITEQKQAEQHKQLLADEMRHRARNLVSIVQAIGRMSRPKNQPEMNKYIDVFMGRLVTLLNTGSIVLSSDTRTADLDSIARTTLSPFCGDTPTGRVTIEGPAVAMPERTAGGLALALHELATNAVKYGSLSAEGGSVSLTWTVETRGGARYFTMEWKESGGPRVAPPTGEGFGGMVIRQSVSRELDSTVTLDFLPEGLQCRLGFRVSD